MNCIRCFILFLVAPLAQLSAGDPADYVDPTIGNISKTLVPTFPTYHLPNEMIRMFPLSKDYVDDQISAFPLQVLSHRSPGIMRMSVITGAAREDDWTRAMTYDHDREVRHPWLYSTYLVDDEITVSFTPGEKVAVYRTSFPSDRLKHLLIQGNGPLKAEVAGNHTFTLEETFSFTTRGIYPETRSTVIHCYAELTQEDGTPLQNVTFHTDENRLRITIPEKGPATVILKYAISYIDAAQARENFSRELESTGFEELSAKGKKRWDQALGKIEVEGGTDAQKRTFYTALYRTYERMVDINEHGRYFAGFDDQVHASVSPFYIDDWSWDSYLAHHPLRTILDPEMQGHILQSYVQMYEQSGWMPTFPLFLGNRGAMNAFHSTPLFLDGLRKGITGFDLETAYEGVRKNITEASMIPWRQGNPKRPIDDFYHKNGYFPALQPGEKETDPMVDSFEKRQAVAVTLGVSFDTWVLSELAGELGKEADQQFFAQRALNYRNLWSPVHRLFMPKDSRGEWIDIDPKFDGGPGGRHYFDENNGWTYAWQVQHDIDGLIDLLGGKAAAESRLDQLFREPLGRSKYHFNAEFPDSTGMVGQFSMGNEPSFHIPYLFNYFGAPWKTQKRIRLLLDVWFTDTLFGIPGDEDGGAMSAFVVFSQMGFYPMVPGLPYYTIGSPVFEKVSVHLDSGRTFTVLAPGTSRENKYIQQAFLNGREMEGPFFTHEDLVNGGTLKLIMGNTPAKTWGKDAFPPY